MRQIAAALLVTNAGHGKEPPASKTPAPPDEAPVTPPPTPPTRKATSPASAWKATHARS